MYVLVNECTSNFSYMVKLSKNVSVSEHILGTNLLLNVSVFFAKTAAKVVLERLGSFTAFTE